MSCAAAAKLVPERSSAIVRLQNRWLRPPGPIARGLRIGLLGGSFNPAHDGHRRLSRTALRVLDLDYVWWLVAPQNPLKPAAGMAPLASRLAGAARLTRHPRIKVGAPEAMLGTRYTVDTLRALEHRFPTVHFVWLMGSDNLLQLPRWRDWRSIFALVPVAVMPRPESALPARLSKPATAFRTALRPADRAFATRKPPALAILGGRPSPASATAIRAANAGP